MMMQEEFNKYYYAFETELYDDSTGKKSKIQFRAPITDSIHDSAKGAIINIIKQQIAHKNIRTMVDYAIDHLTGPVWTNGINQQLLNAPVVNLYD